jgi:hypothetical protein
MDVMLIAMGAPVVGVSNLNMAPSGFVCSNPSHTLPTFQLDVLQIERGMRGNAVNLIPYLLKL